MVYSCSCLMLFKSAREVLEAEGISELATRKVETSTPTELDEEYLIHELGLKAAPSSAASGVSAPLAEDGEKKAFARPKGPGRKR